MGPSRILLLCAMPLLATTAAALADAAAGSVFPVLRPRHPVAVIAHRGGSALAPENTLAALRNAVRLGADFVEIDVRATRDGRLVLMHDGSVDRTTDGTGKVAELDYATIRPLDAGSSFGPEFAGEGVPSFEEALDVCRGRVAVYLDHKDGPVPTILAALDAAGMRDQVVIYDGLDEAREWNRLAPDIPVMVSPEESNRSTEGLAAFLALVPVEVLDGGAHEWTPELVRAAHEVGALVYVDNLGPLDNREWITRSLEMGVDGIQTDHPDVVLGMLRGR